MVIIRAWIRATGLLLGSKKKHFTFHSEGFFSSAKVKCSNKKMHRIIFIISALSFIPSQSTFWHPSNPQLQALSTFKCDSQLIILGKCSKTLIHFCSNLCVQLWKSHYLWDWGVNNATHRTLFSKCLHNKAYLMPGVLWLIATQHCRG